MTRQSRQLARRYSPQARGRGGFQDRPCRMLRSQAALQDPPSPDGPRRHGRDPGGRRLPTSSGLQTSKTPNPYCFSQGLRKMIPDPGPTLDRSSRTVRRLPQAWEPPALESGHSAKPAATNWNSCSCNWITPPNDEFNNAPGHFVSHYSSRVVRLISTSLKLAVLEAHGEPEKPVESHSSFAETV